MSFIAIDLRLFSSGALPEDLVKPYGANSVFIEGLHYPITAAEVGIPCVALFSSDSELLRRVNNRRICILCEQPATAEDENKLTDFIAKYFEEYVSIGGHTDADALLRDWSVRKLELA
jgi:hypothetical protein